MPAISVIVPVYKVEPYLSRCVDSILAQTFTDFELILVDDGSPDNCGKICDEYAQKDNRITVIHRENGGLSAARNSGIDWAFEHSDSQWLTFIDSDDVVTKNYLSEMIDYCVDDDTDVITCKMYRFSSDEACFNAAEEKDSAPDVHMCTEKDAVIHLYKLDGIISIEACTKLFRKSLFYDIRFPEGKVHEDQAVIPLILYKSKKTVSINKPLYGYFTRADSITGEHFSNKRFDDIEALENCIAYFQQNHEFEIVRLANKRKLVLWSLYTLDARKAKAYKTIPPQYKIWLPKALRNLEKSMSYDRFTWRLSNYYPKLVKPYSYWVKLLKTFKLYRNTSE